MADELPMSSSATGDVIALIQKRLLGGEATARGGNGVGACSKEEPFGRS